MTNKEARFPGLFLFSWLYSPTRAPPIGGRSLEQKYSECSSRENRGQSLDRMRGHPQWTYSLAICPWLIKSLTEKWEKRGRSCWASPPGSQLLSWSQVGPPEGYMCRTHETWPRNIPSLTCTLYFDGRSLQKQSGEKLHLHSLLNYCHPKSFLSLRSPLKCHFLETSEPPDYCS